MKNIDLHDYLCHHLSVKGSIICFHFGSDLKKERVKVTLRPSNVKRLYMDEKSTEIGEIKRRIIGK